MPHVPVTFDLEYDREVHEIPAASETQLVFPAPEGTVILSWGISLIDPTVLAITEARIDIDGDTGLQSFFGSIRNTDPVNDLATHWDFVLLRL